MNHIEFPQILITGASGFIGQYAVKYFLKCKWEVFAVIRPSKKGFFKEFYYSKYFHEVLCDLENIHSLTVEGGKIDVFLHLAWSGLERDFIDCKSVQQLNQHISFCCAQTALRLKCKVFIDSGSRAEYGNPTGAMSEAMDCCPVTSYGKTKLDIYHNIRDLFLGEKVAYYHLRIFSVYGRGDHPWSLISTLNRDLAAGKTVALSPCLHYWNFMYIEDAVAAIHEIALRGLQSDRQEVEVVNIASKDTRYLYEFVHTIHRFLGGKGTISFGTFSQGKEAALSVIPDTTHLYELTPQYQEWYTFEDGIKLL